MEKTPGKIRVDQNFRQIILRRVPPSDQALLVYKDPKKFMDGLCSFVREGFKAGETIIVIATPQHLLALENEMRAEGFDIFYMTLRGQFITFNIDTVLEKFMVKDWPDEVLFKH